MEVVIFIVRILWMSKIVLNDKIVKKKLIHITKKNLSVINSNNQKKKIDVYLGLPKCCEKLKVKCFYIHK